MSYLHVFSPAMLYKSPDSFIAWYCPCPPQWVMILHMRQLMLMRSFCPDILTLDICFWCTYSEHSWLQLGLMSTFVLYACNRTPDMYHSLFFKMYIIWKCLSAHWKSWINSPMLNGQYNVYTYWIKGVGSMCLLRLTSQAPAFEMVLIFTEIQLLV